MKTAMNEAVASEGSIDDHIWFTDALRVIVCVLPHLVGYEMRSILQQHKEKPPELMCAKSSVHFHADSVAQVSSSSA
jgi:hypothetical protein